MSEPTAYPLEWPLGWLRTREPKASSFSKKRTLAQARDALLKELRRLGCKREIISSNVLLRRDGLPRSDGGQPFDTGVAVYFWLWGEEGTARVLACDRWRKVEENLHAITLHIEALRAVERYGVGTLDRVFEGYRALPADSSIGSTHRPWWEVLGVSDCATQEQIQAAFRERAREAHPDHGGSADAMAAVNRARDEGLADCRRPRR